jgi:formylglycine-generating enzyme required for sulfatase activity
MQVQTATAFNLPLSSEVGLEMVMIPGGKFWMGSPETEAERDPNEGPRHLVAIASFSLSQFPITQAQWRIVASWPKVKRSLSLYPADFEGDDRPVEQVTWYDCMEFCARLSQYTGQTYRLPSEAEWEYACRAGTTTPFHCGDTLAPDLANYDGNFVYGEGATGAYRQQTTSIRSFRYANPFGLFDMHGNVWEWCLDSWHDSYQEAPVDGRAWEDLDQPYHVLRGGAWYCLPGLCRSAQRHWNQPDTGGSGIGFRVVCEID